MSNNTQKVKLNTNTKDNGSKRIKKESTKFGHWRNLLTPQTYNVNRNEYIKKMKKKNGQKRIKDELKQSTLTQIKREHQQNKQNNANNSNNNNNNNKNSEFVSPKLKKQSGETTITQIMNKKPNAIKRKQELKTKIKSISTIKDNNNNNNSTTKSKSTDGKWQPKVCFMFISQNIKYA